MPAQETVRASFLCRDGGARRELSAGRFVYGMVCLRDCLWDGQFAAPESFQGRGQGRNRGTGQGNRETGNRGIGESGESGAEVRSVSGQWSDRSANRRPVCRPDVSGAGRMAFLRSPKYLRRISCTVRNNPVYLQVRTEEANR